METDSGDRPIATLVPCANPATKKEKQPERAAPAPILRAVMRGVEADLLERQPAAARWDVLGAEDEAERLHIALEFGRRMIGLRQLPRRERAAAYRAAREERERALAALRTKRIRERANERERLRLRRLALG